MIASLIKAVSSNFLNVQILWPDGIFMTKHPDRKPAAPSPGSQNDSRTNYLIEQQRLEDAHRAEFVRELIIGELSTAFPVGLLMYF